MLTNFILVQKFLFSYFYCLGIVNIDRTFVLWYVDLGGEKRIMTHFGKLKNTASLAALSTSTMNIIKNIICK